MENVTNGAPTANLISALGGAHFLLLKTNLSGLTPRGLNAPDIFDSPDNFDSDTENANRPRRRSKWKLGVASSDTENENRPRRRSKCKLGVASSDTEIGPDKAE